MPLITVMISPTTRGNEVTQHIMAAGLARPVRKIQNTPLMNRRLSLAIPPHWPFCPVKCGSKSSQA